MSSSKHYHLTYEDSDKRMTMETGVNHVVHLPKQYRLNMRFEVDPKDPTSWDDRFVLFMSWKGEKFRQIKSVRDDKLDGDDYVDIIFEGCHPDATFSVQHDPGMEGEAVYLFRDVPFSDLFDK